MKRIPAEYVSVQCSCGGQYRWHYEEDTDPTNPPQSGVLCEKCGEHLDQHEQAKAAGVTVEVAAE
jgi:hypothetical protein